MRVFSGIDCLITRVRPYVIRVSSSFPAILDADPSLMGERWHHRAGEYQEAKASADELRLPGILNNAQDTKNLAC